VPVTTGPTFSPLQPGSVASTACECVSLGGVTSSEGYDVHVVAVPTGTSLPCTGADAV
jgi:hypothetical protein